MHPELLAAVKERINIGHGKEDIRAELQAAGYDDFTIEQVYAEAFAELHPDITTNVPKPTDVQADNLSSIEGGSSTVVLPGASTLFGNGWNFMLGRLDLLMVLGAPFAVTALLGFIFGESGSSGVILITGIAGLVALITYIYAWAASIYVVSVAKEQSVDLSSAFVWAKKNIGGLIWVNLLIALVVSGGYLLMIIPGIILSVSLYLSQYVYVKESKRGIAALLRSRDLVKDHWWILVWRLFVLGLIFILTFLFLGGLMGIMVGLGGENGVSDLITDILFQFIGAGATLIGLHAGMELYSNLAVARPASVATTSPEGRGKFITLAWLGVVSIAIFFFVIIPAVFLNFVIGSQGGGYEIEESFEIQQNVNEDFEQREAKDRALEMRAEQLRQDILDAEKERVPTTTEPII